MTLNERNPIVHHFTIFVRHEKWFNFILTHPSTPGAQGMVAGDFIVAPAPFLRGVELKQRRDRPYFGVSFVDTRKSSLNRFDFETS